MDIALKQRLVGASVLIILAVIVLPMLLSGRSDTLKQESRQIELPPKPEELSIETRRFPVGISNPPTPSASQDSESQSAKAQGQEQVAKTTPASASTDKPGGSLQQDTGGDKDNEEAGGVSTTDGSDIKPDSASNTAEPSTVTSITLSSGRDKDVNVSGSAESLQNSPRYLVQVASFSSEKRANALADQLRADQYSVLMDVVDRVAGRLHRVRVGPYVERSDADTVVSDLSLKIKDVSPRVLDLRPTESAPVSTPSDPLVRWVVQVGSFGNLKSADSLVAEVRLGGLAAFTEKVSSAGGTVFKVRVGPEIDRDKATELARKIKVQHPDAFVTTQE